MNRGLNRIGIESRAEDAVPGRGDQMGVAKILPSRCQGGYDYIGIQIEHRQPAVVNTGVITGANINRAFRFNDRIASDIRLEFAQ